MKISTRCVLASLAGLLSACASTPKSYMLVPSGSTVGPLEALSRQPGTMADVYTVNRRERRLLLDGGDGTSLTGHDPDAASASGETAEPVRIPFDDVALVYYRAGGRPVQEVYPVLPVVSAAEQRMSCEELNTEIGRAGTIRWNARQHGAMPFTEHQALVQHGKNTLYYAGMTVLVAAAIVGGGFGGSSSGTSAAVPDPISFETYRWAVTAADQRVLGLLALKRDRPCTPRDTRITGETDLSLLAKIEESRQALADKRLTDQEQINLQSRLLDQFDPLVPGSEQAYFTGAIQVYDEVGWYPNADVTRGVIRVVQGTVWLGKITLTEQALVFRPTSGTSTPIVHEVQVPYDDLAGVEVAHYWRARLVVLIFKDGHKDCFDVRHGSWGQPDATQVAGDFLKSKVPAVSPDAR